MSGKKLIMGSLAAAVILSGSLFGSAQASTTTSPKSAHHRIQHGTVISLSSDHFSLKSSRNTYVVNVSSSTKFLNRAGKVITLSDIKKNDKVNVKGVRTGTTITSSSVRDTTR